MLPQISMSWKTLDFSQMCCWELVKVTMVYMCKRTIARDKLNRQGRFYQDYCNRREIELHSAGTKDRRKLGVAVNYWKSTGRLSWDCGGLVKIANWSWPSHKNWEIGTFSQWFHYKGWLPILEKDIPGWKTDRRLAEGLYLQAAEKEFAIRCFLK